MVKRRSNNKVIFVGQKHRKREFYTSTGDETYFIGIEGGASKTTACLVSSSGQIIDRHAGPSSNPFTIGADECFKILKTLLIHLTSKHPTKPVTSAGIALSGGTSTETIKIQEQLELELGTSIKNYHFTIDTYGAIATACKAGGIVLISGTGSNAMIVDSAGRKLGNCGGWGHFFGDEGSAFDIARRAMQLVIQRADGFSCVKSHSNLDDSGLGVWQEEMCMTRVQRAMMEYFNADDFDALIPHMYPPKFNKTFFANFTKDIAKLALAGDEFSRFLFFECGQHLANHILAFSDHFQTTFSRNKTTPSSGDVGNPLKIRVPIVCEGSVWLSWSVIRSGFVDRLRRFYSRFSEAESQVQVSFRLVRPKVSCAVGAARLAAERFGNEMKLDVHQNVELLDDILWMEIK